jgi:hypothetical protein
MSSGTQIDMDWAGIDSAAGGSAAPPASAANGTGAAAEKYLTDEEILGIDPPSPKDGYGGQARERVGNTGTASTGSPAAVGARHAVPLQPANAGEPSSSAASALDAPAMPEWMAAAAGDARVLDRIRRRGIYRRRGVSSFGNVGCDHVFRAIPEVDVRSQ